RRLQVRIENADGLAPSPPLRSASGQIVRIEDRVADRKALLRDSVEAYRVFVITIAQAVEEDADAAADHCFAALERRPRDAGARREIEFVNQMRLEFVAQTVRERHLRTHTEIIHYEPRAASHVVIKRCVAAVERELRRARIERVVGIR